MSLGEPGFCPAAVPGTRQSSGATCPAHGDPLARQCRHQRGASSGSQGTSAFYL